MNKINRNKTRKNKKKMLYKKNKIEKKLRKTLRCNKHSDMNKIIGGEPPRRSTRGMQTITIPVLSIGTGNPAMGASYNNQYLEENDIEKFVKKRINNGYQLVTIPMPPHESHSILVNIGGTTQNLHVLIVDWGGEANRNNKTKKWKNYNQLISYLEKVYGRVEYFQPDPEIDDIASCYHDNNNGQGGCSTYVHKWVDKYIGNNGEIGILYQNF
tara:strand:+ start:797 stop:1435 length:639 start_codon:yes stop_codon:yes gene_type:complete